jgi:hypothetical protein
VRETDCTSISQETEDSSGVQSNERTCSCHSSNEDDDKTLVTGESDSRETAGGKAINSYEACQETRVIRPSCTIVRDFLRFLRDEFDPVERKIETLLVEHHIRFEYLWRLFPVGSVITFKERMSGLECAGKVIEITYLFL